MTSLFFGIDVSKGYADVCCINQAGSRIGVVCQFDDTTAGHAALKQTIEMLKSRYPDAQMVFGLEHSGGLERNWAVFLRDLATPLNGRVFTLNPLAVKKFLDRDLHRNITDRISAQGIANYLRQGMRPAEIPFEDSLTGPATLYRHLRNDIGRSAQIQNELQSLLPRVQPEMVQFCRQGFPEWALQVLLKYPTAAKLANAGPGKLAKIPHVTRDKAEKLIAAAQESVASQTDTFTEITMTSLVKDLIHAQETVETLKEHVIASMAHDEGVKIMQTIPGIGAWSATCLRLEIGSIERFPAPESLVAFAGLDPRIHQSGDSTKHVGISRRGRRQIRAILYPVILSAIRFNPVIAKFYAGLTARGKGHLKSATACMRKMLHIIYGCWISGKPFDAAHDKGRQERKPRPEAEAATTEQPPTLPVRTVVNAPVSRREAAKRRKATTMPQTGKCRRERGLGVASVTHTT